MTLRLRISPCPNDTFMFDALLNGRIDTGGLHFDVEYRDIEALNRGVQAGEADVSKISCAVLPAVADRYALLDSGAALGRGNGPLLVRRAGDRSPIRRVAVPGVHTTANALMMRLFPRITERTPLLFSQIAAAVERGDFDAGVLIHEGRFVYRQRQFGRGGQPWSPSGSWSWSPTSDSYGSGPPRCPCRWAASRPNGACPKRCGGRSRPSSAKASNTLSRIPKRRAHISRNTRRNSTTP